MIASFRPIFVAFISVLVTVVAREIVFPAPSAHLFQPASLGDLDAIDIVSGSQFSGLTTFANLPYVNCFIDGPASEKYDIAILGAPFDTVSCGAKIFATQCSRRNLCCSSIVQAVL
jgi:agmatinase